VAEGSPSKRRSGVADNASGRTVFGKNFDKPEEQIPMSEHMIAASPEAYAWVTEWARRHDADIFTGSSNLFETDSWKLVKSIGDFFSLVAIANAGGYFDVVASQKTSLPSSLDGAEIILFKNGFDEGFALKHDRVIWMGHAKTTIRKRGLVFAASDTEFDAFKVFAERACRC
jgi:hypothetical protein